MNYQLEQTGEQVQDILNQAPTTEQNLQNEITRSTGKDEELEAAIGNEKNRAEGVEAELHTAIGNEKSRAEGVEGGLRTDVNGIEAKIPTGASEHNKLATESFVNSSVATNTADFKGTFPSLEALQTEVHDANANDYAFVASTDAAGNTVYNRYKYVTGTGWVFEYALNNSSFTAAQWAAIQSGITALLVAKLAGLPTVAELTQQLNTIIASVSDERTRAEGAESVLRQSIADNATAIANEKTRAQNAEGTLSTNIVNEENRAKAAEVVLQQNIDAEAILRDNADDALQAQIDDIDEKIPEQASASNQLADKSFVNSSIATNTADFKGTYNSIQELQQVSANNNDYGFVVSVDSDGNTVYNRYKYVDGTGWVFEYALNNSSFTSAQWAAIQSGITAALVAKLNGLPDITALNAMFAAITNLIPSAATSENKLVDYAQMVAALATKQNTLIFDNVPTENSNNPVKSGGVYSAIATVTAAVVGLQSSKQDMLTFDQYPTPGSNNPVRSTGIYSSIENAVAPKANQIDLDNAVIRISTNEVDIAQLQAAYRGLTQNDVVPVAPTDTWPVANPQENVIYRVADRTNTPPQYYTDYMWNGTAMVLMATYNNAIDPRPMKASQNLVTSGGVFDNMGALDVSELNATENPHTLAIYADLSAALAAIPADYQKGGMSIKFIQGTVQSSDNKYVQYRLMLPEFTAVEFANIAYWQKVGIDTKTLNFAIGSDDILQHSEAIARKSINVSGLLYDASYGFYVYKYDVSNLVGYYIKVKSSRSHSSVAAYTVQDINGTPLIYSKVTTNVQNEFLIRIPNEAENLYISDPNPAVLTIYNLNGYLSSEFDKLIEKIYSNTTTNKAISGIELDGYNFVNASGGITSENQTWRVKKFDISELEGDIHLYSDASAHNSVYAFSVVDEENVVITHATVNVNTQREFVINKNLYPTAKYLYVTDPSYTNNDVKGDYLEIIKHFKDIDSLYARKTIEELLYHSSVKEISLNGTNLSGYHFIGGDGKVKDATKIWKVKKYDVSAIIGNIHLYSDASTHNSVYAFSIVDDEDNVLVHALENVEAQREYTINKNLYPSAKFLYITDPSYANNNVKGDILEIKDTFYNFGDFKSHTELLKETNILATNINNQVNKVYTENNNILWIGTSIPAYATYPEQASLKCGYKCKNNARGSSYIRLGSLVTPSVAPDKDYSLSKTVEEYETQYRPLVTQGLITEATLNSWKNHSYERLIIPYIDGTNSTQVSMIVFDHGFNDYNNIHNLMQDEENIDWDSMDRTNFVGAFNYLMAKIQEINPFLKIVIAGYFQNKVPVYYSDEICRMQELLAKYNNISIMKTWEYSQINFLHVAGTSDYIENYNETYDTSYTTRYPDANGNITSMQLYCPDFIHPHSDLTGNCNKRLNAVFSKLLKDSI